MIGGEHLTSQGIQKSLDTQGTRLCFQMMLRAVLSPKQAYFKATGADIA